MVLKTGTNFLALALVSSPTDIFIGWCCTQPNSNKPRESAAIRYPGSPMSMKSNLQAEKSHKYGIPQ